MNEQLDQHHRDILRGLVEVFRQMNYAGVGRPIPIDEVDPLALDHALFCINLERKWDFLAKKRLAVIDPQAPRGELGNFKRGEIISYEPDKFDRKLVTTVSFHPRYLIDQRLAQGVHIVGTDTINVPAYIIRPLGFSSDL